MAVNPEETDMPSDESARLGSLLVDHADLLYQRALMPPSSLRSTMIVYTKLKQTAAKLVLDDEAMLPSV